MPRMGTFSSNSFGSQCGAPFSYTLDGPPEKMRPRGCSSATRAAGRSWRTSWQKTFCSRTRRAMSWPYCAPKSKISTRSLSGSSVIVVHSLRRRFVVGTQGEQLLEHGFVIDVAIAAIAFDGDSTLLEKFDFPVFARGKGH